LEFFHENKDFFTAPKNFNAKTYIDQNFERLYPELLTLYAKKLLRMFRISMTYYIKLIKKEERDSAIEKDLHEQVERERKEALEHERQYELKYGKPKKKWDEEWKEGH